VLVVWGFSIALVGLGFTIGISGSWLTATSALSVILASFLLVPEVKRWAGYLRRLPIWFISIAALQRSITARDKKPHGGPSC